MCYNQVMENKKLKIQNLIKLRVHYYTTFILITTGVLGLFFVNISKLKLLILLLVGVFYIFVFLLKFLDLNEKISNIIEKD